MERHQPTFHIHVIWHAQFEQGRQIAERLYDRLTRNLQKPADRGLGIPLYFTCRPADGSSRPPPAIDFSVAHRTAVLVLVDDEMVLDRDNWGPWLNQTATDTTQDPQRRLLLPIAYTRHMANLPQPFSNIQGIRWSSLAKNKPEAFSDEEWQALSEGEREKLLDKERNAKLYRHLYHELCRFYEHPNGEPVTLFLSHGKKDGMPILKKMRDWIQKENMLNTWFDVKDIAIGSDWREQIIDGVNSAFLAIQTDVYSSREWCRIECLTAKEKNIPILVVDAVQSGEDRSFPYLGNVPTVRWQGNDANCADIVEQTLREVLRHRYQTARLTDHVGARPDTVTYHRQPELLTLLNERHRKGEAFDNGALVHPDPPLPREELALLHKHWPNLKITTPTLLDTGHHPLADKTIVLSVSDSGDLDPLGLSSYHLNDAVVELVRYLLCQGATVAYGGALIEKGFVDTVLDVVDAYMNHEKVEVKPLEFRPAWPFSLKADKNWLLTHQNLVAMVAPVIPESVRGWNEFDEQTFPDLKTREARLAACRCLTAMRQASVTETHARVVLGGKEGGAAKPSLSSIPGVVEEALLELKGEQPTYIMGGFGGAGRVLAEALQGKRPIELTLDFQKQDPAYAGFLDYYNEQEPPIDYEAITDFFNQAGPGGLRNGLSDEENQRLFITRDVLEMATLVLRGLNRLFNPHQEEP